MQLKLTGTLNLTLQWILTYTLNPNPKLTVIYTVSKIPR